MRRTSLVLAMLALAAAGCGVRPAGPAPAPADTAAPQATPMISSTQPDWTSYHHDGSREGVADGTAPLHPLHAEWTSPALDGAVYGQPVGYGGRIYVATENDTVYALNAATGGVLWSKHVATAVPASALPCGDISPTVGITSTMVLDPGLGRLFAVADTVSGGTIRHYLYGFNTTTGAQAFTPRVVDPSGSSPATQLQRAGLALAGGYVVIGFGGNAGDCGNYHGYVASVAESGSGSLYWYEVASHSSNGGAVWQGGAAPSVDSSGHVFVATGNAQNGGFCDYGNSVLELSSTMVPLGHWSDPNCVTDNNNDADLGSSEPILLPGGLAFIDGKQSVGYLLTTSSMTVADSHPVCDSFGGDAYAYGRIYVSCTSGVQAWSLNTSTRKFAYSWQGSSATTGPPIVAGGLVWSVDTGGTDLYGLNPTTGATVVHVTTNGVEHFTSPTALGGRLLVAAGSYLHAWLGPDQAVAATVGTNHNEYIQYPGHPWTTLGGDLVATPTLYTWGGGIYSVGIGTNHNIWARSVTGGNWTIAGPSNTYCSSVATAVVGNTLDIACTGRNLAVFYAHAALSAGHLPLVSSWTSLGGNGTGGVALAPVRGTLTFLAAAGTHAVSRRTLSSSWTATGYQCAGQPTMTAGDYLTWFACVGPNGNIYYSTNLGTSVDAGSVSTGTAGLAVAPDGTADLYGISPSTSNMYRRVVGTVSSQPWVNLGGTCRDGAAAVTAP